MPDNSPIKRGPPFTALELQTAQETAAVGRIGTNVAWMEERIPHLQRRGLISVKVVDYAKGKPLWVDVALTEAAQEAIMAMSESSVEQDRPAVYIPEGLRTDPPPENGDQIVAWAIDLWWSETVGGDDEGRWVIAQFVPAYRGGKPSWTWTTPGRSTVVKILGWLPLPCMDRLGRAQRGE